jgi:hypothetical protein
LYWTQHCPICSGSQSGNAERDIACYCVGSFEVCASRSIDVVTSWLAER